jgi:hypothetical protein
MVFNGGSFAGRTAWRTVLTVPIGRIAVAAVKTRASAALTIWTAGRPAGSAAHRAKLIRGELAIAIFIELFERGGSIGDFFCRDDAVVIRVQSFLEWTDGRAKTAPARPAWSNITRRSALWPAFRGRRAIATRRLTARVLRGCVQGCQTEGQS